MNFNLRLVLAFIIGGALVSGAFWLQPNEQGTTFTNNPSDTPSVREFIQVKDSDKNGVPDWQEVFAINTINLDDITNTGSTTRTGRLIASLADYLSGEQSTASEALALIGNELAAESLDSQYTTADIITSDDNSEVVLRAYGNKVAEIAMGYPLPPGTKNELAIMQEYSSQNNPEALKSLEPIIYAYEAMRDDMLKIPVPSSMVKEHLSLTNVYNALSIDIQAFRNTEEDALPTTLRYKRYPADAAALKAAISNLYLKLHQNGIQWSEYDSASKFVEINI